MELVHLAQIHNQQCTGTWELFWVQSVQWIHLEFWTNENTSIINHICSICSLNMFKLLQTNFWSNKHNLLAMLSQRFGPEEKEESLFCQSCSGVFSNQNATSSLKKKKVNKFTFCKTDSVMQNRFYRQTSVYLRGWYSFTCSQYKSWFFIFMSLKSQCTKIHSCKCTKYLQN